jgi:hypothetical protein
MFVGSGIMKVSYVKWITQYYIINYWHTQTAAAVDWPPKRRVVQPAIHD